MWRVERVTEPKVGVVVTSLGIREMSSRGEKKNEGKRKERKKEAPTSVKTA
jgi:hypothetical protein